MENIEVAKILNQIADILELKEENIFRIRSYRRSAQTIQGLPERIETIAREGNLEDIPGIGKNIAWKITEIIKTGKCRLYNDLLKTPEAKLIEMMNIPGLGPKLSRQLYKKLNITDINQLEKAAKKGKLSNLERLGEKSQEKILKGIQHFKKSRGRFKLSEALPYAETILEKLKEKNIKDISYAGSLRRMKETVGDIDILITAKNNYKIMDKFTSLPEVKDVLAKGNTKSSVILTNGIQLDLRLIAPESFGAALVYFTGSKQHNIAIREIAKKKSIKINEYGAFNVKTNKKIAGKNEQEVYKSIGLSYIPPELREDNGEIQASQENKLPKLVTLSDYKGDLQMHTKHTDGANTIEEMAKVAIKKGYKYIAITDHSKAVRIARGLNQEQLLKELKEIERINKRIKDITILSGIEVDILTDGNLDLPDKILSKCDVVVASIHSKFMMPRDEMTKRIITAFKNKNVNILAHPTGRILKKREPYQVDMDKIIKAAKQHKIALELNAYPDRLDIDSRYCKACKEAGVKVAINTDAHNIRQLDVVKYGIYIARRGWLEASDIINTYPVAKLKKFLNKQ